jgi:hypothetical protein
VTAATEPTTTPTPRPAPALIAPLALWLAIQLAALLLAASRVPLSARYPTPEESLAVHVLVIVQIAASAMLFPLLFRGLTTSIVLIATTIPFLQLAAFLAAQTDNRRLALCSIYVALWLAGLALLNASLPSTRTKMYGVALATAISLGGAILAYLHREFGAPATTFDWSQHAFLGPIMGCMAILGADPAAGTIWFFLGSVLMVGLAAFTGRRWRQVIHTKRTETQPGPP